MPASEKWEQRGAAKQSERKRVPATVAGFLVVVVVVVVRVVVVGFVWPKFDWLAELEC